MSEALNYTLLINSVLNVVGIFFLLKFLEYNLRMNWLVKEEVNISSILVVIILICFFFKEISLSIGFLRAIMASNAVHPFLSIFETTPWILVALVLMVALGLFVFITIRKYKVMLVYKDEGSKIVVTKIKKK